MGMLCSCPQTGALTRLRYAPSFLYFKHLQFGPRTAGAFWYSFGILAAEPEFSTSLPIPREDPADRRWRRSELVSR
jgi:hypothetical protein